MKKRLIRLSGGTKKKSTLKIPKGIRPTRGIVRRSIFDRLGPFIEGKRVLELFAGTGAIGLEAISRGAEEVWFVEKSVIVSRVLEKNIKNLSFEDKAHILKKDVRKALDILKSMGEKFDVAFSDPPYAFHKLEETLSEIGKVLNEEGIFILEVKKDTKPPQISGLSLEKEVRFGETKILWYSCVSR